MSEFPTKANVVVIGAGIVGNCLVGHLARLGWQDLVLIDKGPLPNPGGSTGHASNFIFPVDHNKEMALLGEQSANQFRDLNLSVDSGGIEVARTQERMDELQRRMTSAKAWGIEAHLLTPAEVKELVPFINEEVILGGFYCPTVSVVDSLETGTTMRKEAIDKAGCKVFANTEVLDLITDDTPTPQRPSQDHRSSHRQRRHCHWLRDHRLRCVVQPHSRHGRHLHPSRARRAPDGRCRSDGHPRRNQQ